MTNPTFKHSLSGLSECLVSPATPYIGMAFLKRISASCLPVLSWENIKENPGLLIYAAPGPATFMHMLVFSAATGVVLNAVS
ncbi:MAG: hypothetical protein AB2535_18690 [Candidatus Thiodiazotropha endolucinida]